MSLVSFYNPWERKLSIFKSPPRNAGGFEKQEDGVVVVLLWSWCLGFRSRLFGLDSGAEFPEEADEFSGDRDDSYA